MQTLKNEWKFIALIAAFVATATVWNSWGLAPLSASIAQARQDRDAGAQELNELNAQGVPSDEQIAVARDAAEGLKMSVGRLEPEIAHLKDPRFQPPPGQSAAVHFHNKLAEAWRDLNGRTQMKNIAWERKDPNLGFPPGRIADELGDEFLVRLSLVYRVIEAMLDQPSGAVHRIKEVQPAELGEFGPGGSGGAAAGEFAALIPVRFRFEAKGETAFQILHSLLQKNDSKNQTGVVVTGFVANRPEQNEDRLVVDLSVAAVVMAKE